MFLRISNTPRPYAWGSTTAIAELLGTEASGGPEAELWLGTHPGSPARLVDSAAAETLGEYLGGDGLPFLLKVLAAGSPLSLQAHPTTAQAREGFARENAAGIPLDAPHRNYKDPFAKPEIIYALSPRFEALCGFRDQAETLAVVRALAGPDAAISAFAARIEAEPLAEVFEWLITRGEGVELLVERVVVAAEGVVSSRVASVASVSSAVVPPKTKEIRPESTDSVTNAVEKTMESFVFDAAEMVRMLAAEYPGDPGIVIALLLNKVTLARGEALYLPAGNIHAYLNGLGVELMAASDNVLRGGLTPKHVDVGELLSVLDFTPSPVPYIRPSTGVGTEIFRPEGTGFELVRVTEAARIVLTGPAIALCTEGPVTIAGAATSVELHRGDAVYVSVAEGELIFEGAGEVFLAQSV